MKATTKFKIKFWLYSHGIKIAALPSRSIIPMIRTFGIKRTRHVADPVTGDVNKLKEFGINLDNTD